MATTQRDLKPDWLSSYDQSRQIPGVRVEVDNDKWAQRDSNPRHLPCKGSALTS